MTRHYHSFFSKVRRERPERSYSALLILFCLLFPLLVHAFDMPWEDAVQPNNIWSDMRTHFKLPHDPRDPLVQEQIRWYLNHRAYLDRVLDRSIPYLYHVYSEVRKRNMPAELALLPIIESAYNPFVSSPAGASGLWQLMPRTASGFGIKRNWWYDGRKDVVNSTKAALNYLGYLKRFFNGNWFYAIAAYDLGEGNLLNAIRRNIARGLGTDYGRLSLPMETKTYVPRLIAVACLIEHPERYGLTLPYVKNKPYFNQVYVGSQIDLTHAAKLAGITSREMSLLNPGFSRWATDPSGPHFLLVPSAHADQFKRRLSQATPQQRLALQYHKVKHGESLNTIARRYGTSSGLIKQANHLVNNRLAAGKQLIIPHIAKAPSSVEKSSTQKTQQPVTMPPLTATKTPLPVRTNQEHTIAAGDTMDKIAKHYHLTTAQLQKTNPKLKANHLVPGQKIKLPVAIAKKAPSTLPTKAIKTASYVVKSGDTLIGIAHHHHLDAKKIKTINRLKTNALKPGQKLILG